MKRKMLEKAGASCMALAMLLMLNGGVNIHAEEETAEALLTAQEKAAPAASLDTTGLKNAEATLQTAADGKLTLVVKAKNGYYFASIFVRMCCWENFSYRLFLKNFRRITGLYDRCICEKLCI